MVAKTEGEVALEAVTELDSKFEECGTSRPSRTRRRQRQIAPRGRRGWRMGREVHR